METSLWLNRLTPERFSVRFIARVLSPREEHTWLLEDEGEMMESHQKPVLSYGARREVLAQIASRYQQATGAQKTLLLDRAVELIGYGRKYLITLLNHVPSSPYRMVRPRLPIYGSVVQEALFLAWRTIQYPCAKRLVPCLPELIPVLEQDGHLQLGEDHRRQLLAMSVRTAERLLSTQRRPTPHGFSTTKPGTLLKHQISIRTFAKVGTMIAPVFWKRIWERIVVAMCMADISTR